MLRRQLGWWRARLDAVIEGAGAGDAAAAIARENETLVTLLEKVGGVWLSDARGVFERSALFV